MPKTNPAHTLWKIKDKQGKTWHVRTLLDSDTSKFQSFFNSLSKESKHTFQPHPFTPQFVEKMCRDWASSTHLRLIAVDPVSKKIVGYLFISRLPLLPQFGYFGIAVADDYQGRGLASGLLETCFSYAQQKGIQHIYLNVMAKNKPAINAYQKCGFAIISAPVLLSKLFTLYQLWYNGALADLLKAPKTGESTSIHEVVWMVKQL